MLCMTCYFSASLTHFIFHYLLLYFRVLYSASSSHSRLSHLFIYAFFLVPFLALSHSMYNSLFALTIFTASGFLHLVCKIISIFYRRCFFFLFIFCRWFRCNAKLPLAGTNCVGCGYAPGHIVCFFLLLNCCYIYSSIDHLLLVEATTTTTNA